MPQKLYNPPSHSAFEHLRLALIVAFISMVNLKLRAVMERLGMWFVGEFDHPHVAIEAGQRRHVLYRLNRPNEIHTKPLTY